jgi:acyl carrier protein
MRPHSASTAERSALRTALEPTLRAVVAEQLGIDEEELLPDVSLQDDLAVDSLDLLDLALALETRLGVRLAKREVGGVRTYREEMVAEDAARAGRGARLELAVPLATADGEIDGLQARLAWLGRLGVQVHVARVRTGLASGPRP